MTEKQLLVKLEKERDALEAQSVEVTTRIGKLDDAITALRVLTGQASPKRRGTRGGATGTKALILDVLADGTRRSCPAIAVAMNAKSAAVGKHLTELVANGDVTRKGKSRATTYGIK
jgi:hypothetical protein